MIFIISSFYYEVGITFKISHKVLKLIREKMNENYFSKDTIVQTLGNKKCIRLEISARELVNEVQVMGPTNEETDISFFVLLPYKDIISSENQLETFIKSFFIAIGKILDKYNIERESLQTISEEVLTEVINNEKYVYTEAYKFKKNRMKGKGSINPQPGESINQQGGDKA